MIVPEKNQSGTYAGVLRAGLGVAEDSSILYQNGDENWDEAVSIKKTERPEIVWNALADKKLSRNLPRRTPSSMELQLTPQRADPKTSEVPAGTATASRHDLALRGTAIHACFANVKWLNDDEFDKQTFQKIVRQSVAGKQGNIDAMEIVNEFRSMLQQSEVRKSFMRSSYPKAENVDVENERRFVVRYEGELLLGSMDRLVIRKQGDKVIGLEIIDFKADRPMSGESEAEFLAGRKRIYSPQLAAYRQAAAVLYPNVQDITAKLVFVSLGRTVNV
jgi:ATP-dependent exoDNAse (exonuclease V) beta subunit